jgi:hypothetical protein
MVALRFLTGAALANFGRWGRLERAVPCRPYLGLSNVSCPETSEDTVLRQSVRPVAASLRADSPGRTLECFSFFNAFCPVPFFS